MSFPWSIDIINDKILTFSTRGEYFIKVYDANNGMELHHTGHFGGGPKELLSQNIGVKMSIMIYLFMI